MRLIWFLVAILVSLNTWAMDEPAYCEYENFKQLEIKELDGELKRLRAFQIGDVLVAGLAVGKSKPWDVSDLAKTFSRIGKEKKYCTWYINRGNVLAQQKFNHEYVPKPTSPKVIGKFFEKLAPEFSEEEKNIVQCAEDAGYIALGCNGQKHRGPTFYGMILAYSGCSAESANNIVNTVWGLNGIDPRVRQSIIFEAYKLGRIQEDASTRLRELFEGSK